MNLSNEYLKNGYNSINKEIYESQKYKPEYSTKIAKSYFMQVAGEQPQEIEKELYKIIRTDNPSAVTLKKKYFSKKIQDSSPESQVSNQKIEKVKERQFGKKDESGIEKFLRENPELATLVMNNLSILDEKRMALVSKTLKTASELPSNKSATEIALQNLELIRPIINKLNRSGDAISSLTFMKIYLNAKGELVAYKGRNTPLCIKEPDSNDFFIEKETRGLNLELPVNSYLSFITFYWSTDRTEGGTKDCFSRGVISAKIMNPKNINEEVLRNFIVQSVRDEMFVIANQLWHGARKVAIEENNKELLWMEIPNNPYWEGVFEDPIKYPTKRLLEAGKDVKYLKKETVQVKRRKSFTNQRNTPRANRSGGITAAPGKATRI